MTRYGYHKKLSTGIVASVGTIGILIPPSITMIIYGIMTEQSIGRLFLAGMIPGLLISLFFIGIIYVWCKSFPRSEEHGNLYRSGKTPSLPELICCHHFGIVIGGSMVGHIYP